MSVASRRLIVPIAVGLLALTARADLLYPDFSGAAGLQLLQDAQISGTRLRLTDAANNERGAAWFTTAQRVSTQWVADFEFQVQGGPGADGFVFLIQNASTNQVGQNGCRLGYHGISNSVAVEFDTFNNGGSCEMGTINDLPAPHLSVHTQGTGSNSVSEGASLGSTTAVPAFSSGGLHTARLHYIPGTLLIYVDDLVTPALAVSVDLSTTLSLASGKAWVGFTASTGGLNETHEILSFSFDEDSAGSGGNSSPLQPTITEPAVDGQIVNPSDVHMETSAFVDPDSGDQHLCSDFEIWTLSPSGRAWVASCIGGVAKLHTHLGDGVFENSHAGFSELTPGTQYLLRARHRDDSGVASTEWGPWSQRFFTTGTASDTFPLVTEEIEDEPEVAWTFASGGGDVVLAGGGAPATLRLDNPQAGLLLEIAGFDGNSNVITNPPELSEHVAVRVHLEGGGSGINLSATNLVVYDHECVRYEVLLPAVALSVGQDLYLWVSSTGTTYHGTSSQNDPVFGSLARGLDIPWSVRQAGYGVELFASGFELPVNIGFVPNPGPEPNAPFFYVTELYGQVRVVTRDGTVSTFASGLIDFNPTGNFPGSGEQGLTGIVVDSGSGDVFVSLLRDSTSNPGTHYPRVLRLTSGDGGYTSNGQSVVLDMSGESQGQSHQISNLSIHPDGKLLVHMGDGFNSSTALNLHSYRGSILRMNLDGSPANDNPFYNLGNGTDSEDYIFAYGIRNAFGGAWRALDGRQYTVENGPSIDRIGKVLPGRNFGWDGSQNSMTTHALYVWNPAHGPVNMAFVQPETFGGSGFPPDKMDHAFVTESGPTYATGGQARGKRISEFVFDANGDLVTGPLPFLEYGGTGKETACGLAAGPDGLYMTSLYRDTGFNPTASGARIYRVHRQEGWDCNDNGVPDECDIASGVERDLDDNGLPDSCDCAGVNFCEANVNSTGSAASISSNGQCNVAQNQFVLTAQPVPAGPGLFFFSSGQLETAVPLFNGVRCIGPSVVRLPVVLSNLGSATHQLDFNTGTAAMIQAGQTRHFQYWFRDVPGGGLQANLSNGLSVAFQ
jgi:glucose/arabinose dehydrogenase